MQKVLESLSRGGVAVYPTETLYALGCVATDENACARVAAIKKRPSSKPLPLIVGWREGLKLVSDDIPRSLVALVELFWPGPLSVLVRAKDSLAPQVSDENGFTSVRLCPHPVAAALSRELAAPLVATSANISGRAAAAVPDELDSELMEQADAAYLGKPWPMGGVPSTVVRLKGGNELEVVRPGAVPLSRLEEQGFVIR